VSWLWGATPGRAWVELDDDRLVVRFGYVGFTTATRNLAHWRIEGPFRWIMAIGVRRSIRGGDVTFAGSHHGAVRVDLHQPVRWLRIFRVPAVYLAVDDLTALAAELERRGIEGTDARKAPVPIG
jgi:hypothetical protein